MLSDLMSNSAWVIMEFIGQVFGQVASVVRGPVRLAMVLYIIVYGLMILRGAVKLELGDLGLRLFKAGFVITLATEWWFFSEVVFDAAWSTFDELGSYVLGALDGGGRSARSIWQTLDATFKAMMDVADSFFGNSFDFLPGPLGSILNTFTFMFDFRFDKLVAGLLLVILSVLLYGCAAAISITAMLNFAIVIAIAPIFMSFYLFDATRSMAESWVRTVLGVVLLPAALQMALVLAIKVMPTPTPTALGMDVWGACLVLFACFLFILQVPSLVTGLVGSVANSLDSSLAHSFAGAVKGIGDMAKSAAAAGVGKM